MNKIVSLIEFSYLAYMREGGVSQMNEAHLLRWLSKNFPMSGIFIRSPGLGGVKGGPTHNENGFDGRLIPQAKVFCPGSGYSAVVCARSAFEMVKNDYVILFIEPTAMYAQKDLFPNDGKWLSIPPSFDQRFNYGDVIGYKLNALGEIEIIQNKDILEKCHERFRILTYGNGVPMSLRASKKIKETCNIDVSVIEFPNLGPSTQLLEAAKNSEWVLVADEARPVGSPGESVIAALVNSQYKGNLASVNSDNTYIPSGPAGKLVYLNEDKIFDAAEKLLRMK